MQIIHEDVEFFDGMPLNISIKKLTNTSKHWHNCLELCLVLTGSLTITIEAESYHLYEDDIILINSDQLHQFQGEDNVVVTIQIDLSFYKKGLEKGIYFLCNSGAYHNKNKFLELKRLIAKIIYIHYNDTDGNELLTMSYSYLLILELLKNFKSTQKKSLTCTSKNLLRLGDVIQYLSENYAEEITLEQVAERTFLSPSYLSHFFKVNMNVSFFNYLTGIRLHHAVNDLLQTSLSIEQIAANNGFANSRYLVNAFKKQFDMLPREYRSKYKKEGEVEKEKEKKHTDYSQYLMLKQHNFLNKLGEYLEIDALNENIVDTTIKTRATIEVDATNKLRILSHTFKMFTGVGRARELLLEPVRQQLRILQKEIGFRYLKFHGILDDSMMLYNEDQQGKPYLTYLYVDQVIDFLLSIQLKPLIQFSFMPRALAKDPSNTIFYNPVIISEPKDYSKWEFLITNLTNHLIERYSLEEVRQWFFSFWNVPFTCYIFTFETNEIGYELYKITRACVKACDSQLIFGSPSYGSMNFTGDEFYDFLEYCKANRCYPDFYNLHYYPVKSSSGQDLINFGENANQDAIILSDNPDKMKESIVNFKDSLTNYPKLPIYITEWASTTSHREWLNDTCYRSAYIVKNILENYDQVGSFGNWCLSDILEELPYDQDVFHGELGLFTVNGIKKPAYYAFTFLNKLLNTLIAQGNGYFITTNHKGDYAILLYNYIHISPLYGQGVLFNVTFLERYNAFVNPSPLEIDFKLSNTENACYTVTEHIVNREYGSAFDEWVRMGAIALRTEEEINTLRGRSMPRITKTNMEVRNNQINYFATLEPHEIRLITINITKKKG
jgi:xylan 1,4-beta-xylosidase